MQDQVAETSNLDGTVKNTECSWSVSHIISETESTKSLYLKAKDQRPDFIAGQYLTIKIPGQEPSEGKAYSISSAPYEDLIRITIKKIGNFSSTLLSLQPGDDIFTSAPYGFFYPEPEEQNDLVFVVGGIGITPCLSIMKQLIHTKDPRNIQLFYSNQTVREIAFKSELDELSKDNQRFNIDHFITRETQVCKGCNAGRFTAEKILNKVPDRETANFFICGSMDLTRSLMKELKGAGIQQQQLYTESFF